MYEKTCVNISTLLFLVKIATQIIIGFTLIRYDRLKLKQFKNNQLN